MLNYRTLAIIKRELKERMMSKAFIISTILLPVFMFGVIGVQSLLMMYEGDSNTKVEILTESQELSDKLQNEFSEKEFVKSGDYILSYNLLSETGIEDYVKENRARLLGENLNAIIFVPNSALSDKKVSYYSNIPNNRIIPEKLDGTINKILIEEYFSSKELSEEDLNFARKGIDITGYKVSDKEEIAEEGFGNIILAYVFLFLLYISLLMMGQMIMQSVQEEKTSKIVEILLSSVKSKELMTGKILGTAITGTVQMFIWMLPILAIISTSWFALPPEITMDITYGHLLYIVFNFFLGLIVFSALYATIGAIFDNAQEAQSGMWPVMLLIMIPFFIAFTMMRNPTNPVAIVASYVPFANILVMPVRLALTELSIWQLLISLIINLGTIAAIFPLAGKIYRVGILRTGKKPTWGEVIKWVKFEN